MEIERFQLTELKLQYQLHTSTIEVFEFYNIYI